MRADVVAVVQHVVEVVAGDRVDGELTAVVAQPAAGPGLVGGVPDRVVPRRDRLGRRHQLGADDRGVLEVVALLDGGDVLVPVGEGRLVLREHQVQPRAEDAVHVADVAGVLQRRPGVLVGPLGAPRLAQHGGPARRVVAQQPAEVLPGQVGGDEATLGAGSAEDPGPVLGVGLDAGLGAGLDHWHIIIEPVTVRSADPADLPRIAAIYDEQVRNAISTFDLEPPGLCYWEARLASDQPGDHVLVADSPSGEVVGYAYSSSYRPRPAYARTREVSVYLDDVGARAGPGPPAVRRAARPAARRRRAPGARGDRAAERRERGAAPLVRLLAGRAAARGRVEVRPLDRHAPLWGLRNGPAGVRRASRIGDAGRWRRWYTESQSPTAARHGVRVRPESWRTP